MIWFTNKAKLKRQVENQREIIAALMSRPVLAFAEFAYRITGRYGWGDPGPLSHFLQTHIAGHRDELQCLKECEYTEPAEEQGS